MDFEEWFKTHTDEPEWFEGWNRTDVELAFAAGRESMKEEAAKVADDNDMKLRVPTYKTDIANAIRNLK